MASSSHSCGVCDLRQINKPSIIWCTECDEGLCQKCQEHHSLSKGSRKHNTIAITEYLALHSDVLKITQYCSIHKDKFIMYCRKDERPCCRKCIVETHKESQDIDNLEDVTQNVKISNAVHDIEETLVEIAGNLKKISQHQQKNLLNLKEKRKQIEKDIQKTRTTINNHLDKLQEDLIKKLNAIEETQNSKICQLLSSLEQRERQITKYKENFSIIKQHASDLQIFLSLKQIEEDIDIEDKFLQAIVKGEELKQCHLEYRTNIDIQNIMSKIKTFGEVHIEHKPCDIVLSRKKTRQAQIMVPTLTVQPRSLENIKLKKNKTITTKGTYIFGCCMIPDRRMAFTYFTERAVRIFKHTGLKEFEVKMPTNVQDILYISEDNTLAVTSGGSSPQCITIINVERKQITKTISLDSEIYGIALIENQLIYSGKENGIRMINLHDESITLIVPERMPHSCYIATFRNKIYHTNSETHAITCYHGYDQQGKLQWTFKNESLLKSPRGIAVDIDGYVYVVGVSSHNVVIVFPDGQCHREILKAIDGLDSPISICYDDSTKQLLVANCNNEARLFAFV